MFNVSENDSFASIMGNFPKFEYSINDVKKAGEELRGDIVWDEKNRADAIEIFAIAHSWRDSHIFPMHSIRKSVNFRRQEQSISGFTAARPKRMASIRKKLRRSTIKLNQINDLGGCRVVVDNMDGVNKLIEICRNQLPHELRQEYDYISVAKKDGYRSHHMVFEFRGKKHAKVYDGRRVELQLRTRMQHSWATAVEAVGLYRNEDFKAGEGNPQWLRLFALLSNEFAHVEGPNEETQEQRHERIEEIRELNNMLSADKMLEHINHVTHYVTNYIKPSEKDTYFLIQYKTDHLSRKKTVTVEGYSTATDGSRGLGAIERAIERKQDNVDAVLVEANKIDSLIEMFPNYFGDVKFLTSNLKLICKGKDAVEFHMAPQKTVAPKQKELPDPTLLRRRYTHWTEPKKNKQ